jgi:hypothetical protein
MLGAVNPGTSIVTDPQHGLQHEEASMTHTLVPFADDAASLSVGEMTLENGQERIAFYGNLDLSRDKQGLQHARALKAVLDQVVRVLEADEALPDKITPPEKPVQVKNPFA